MKETMAMRAPLLERLEELLDRGGTKKDVALLAVSAVALGFSFFAPETLPFNPAWIAIVLCGAPIILGAVIGLVTEFDIKADVLVSLALIAAVAIGGTSMSGGKAVVVGTLIGALVMQVITTMMNMNNIFYAYALVVKSAIIVVALYLQREKG